MWKLWTYLRTHRRHAVLILGVLFFVLLFVSVKVSDDLHRAYQSEVSARVFDRNGAQLKILANAKGGAYRLLFAKRLAPQEESPQT